jgi:site-specific DNA-methyltransferase (adenine-specific)
MRTLDSGTVHALITSPPYYGLRDYDNPDQIGLESSVDEYVEKMVEVFREVKRVLRDDGTVWLNIGDTYADKELLYVPARLGLALQRDGWILRQDIIWNKPNAMPESVKDRCSTSHEHILMLTKSKTYYYDLEAVKEKNEDTQKGRRGNHKGRNKTQSAMGDRIWTYDYSEDMKRTRRTVWTFPTKAFTGAHFAVYPPALIEPCVLSTPAKCCAECGMGYVGAEKQCDCGSSATKPAVILDCFAGSGTTGAVAIQFGRSAVLIELNTEYAGLIPGRIETLVGMKVAEGEKMPNVRNNFDGWFSTEQVL